MPGAHESPQWLWEPAVSEAFEALAENADFWAPSRATESDSLGMGQDLVSQQTPQVL